MFIDNLLRLYVVDKDYEELANKATSKAADAAKARTLLTSVKSDKKGQGELLAEARFMRGAVSADLEENGDEFDSLEEESCS